MARQYKTNEVKVDLASYRHYWRGVKKAGKTTLFYQLMMALYGDPSYGLELSVGNERGFKALDGMVYDEAPDWPTLMEIVDDLIENKEDNHFKFICIDTVDELVSIAKKEVIRLDFRKTGERHEFNACFGGYGHPREKVQELIDNLMTRLEDSGYGLIWIGHTKYRTVNEKNGDSYDYNNGIRCKKRKDIFGGKAAPKTEHVFFDPHYRNYDDRQNTDYDPSGFSFNAFHFILQINILFSKSIFFS